MVRGAATSEQFTKLLSLSLAYPSVVQIANEPALMNTTANERTGYYRLLALMLSGRVWAVIGSFLVCVSTSLYGVQ